MSDHQYLSRDELAQLPLGTLLGFASSLIKYTFWGMDAYDHDDFFTINSEGEFQQWYANAHDFYVEGT